MARLTGQTYDLKVMADLLGLQRDQLLGGLNLVEAARVLGIVPSTLRQRALAGKIGHQRDGRAWRFYWWHLGAYLTARERPAASGSSEGNYVENVRRRGEAELEGDANDTEAEAIKLGLL